jgi:hypothetical protein
MPRAMPGLEAEFRARVSEAIRLAEIGEVARAEARAGSQTRQNLHPARLELLYELAYLRMFVSWEAFLEQTFLRYLCGYASKVGVAVPAAGTSFAPTLASAETTVLAGRRYVLWHNPSTVVERARQFFTGSVFETVILSNTARLDQFAAVRHRITHSQSDSRRRFDAATMMIAGTRYKGGRAGAFLRDVDRSIMPPVRRVEHLGRELQGLAAQIA